MDKSTETAELSPDFKEVVPRLFFMQHKSGGGIVAVRKWVGDDWELIALDANDISCLVGMLTNGK